LKVEARESAHEVMNMEGIIAELKEENERLLSQIEKIASEDNQGDNLKEHAIREEIETIYKGKLFLRSKRSSP
jgi:DNA-binding ferritin-like protein